MIDLLSGVSGSTYQHSSQRTPPPPRLHCSFPASSAARTHFLTTIAHLSSDYSLAAVVWLNRVTLNHVVAINNTSLSFSVSEQWKFVRQEGKKRPPWRPNARRPALGCREPPRSWRAPTNHSDLPISIIVWNPGSQQPWQQPAAPKVICSSYSDH